MLYRSRHKENEKEKPLKPNWLFAKYNVYIHIRTVKSANENGTLVKCTLLICHRISWCITKLWLFRQNWVEIKMFTSLKCTCIHIYNNNFVWHSFVFLLFWTLSSWETIPQTQLCLVQLKSKMTYDMRNYEKNHWDAYSRLILSLPRSFLVSPLLAMESWSWVKEERIILPSLIHGTLKEGDHFLRAQRPTRKSPQSMRSQSWFKRMMSQVRLQAFSRNKAILYNNNPRLPREALLIVK